jgi:evolutionarily conserved signaling intermediate in Toll pathway
MIRRGKCILTTLIDYRSRYQVFAQSRIFCSNQQNEENKFDQDQKRREQKHEFFEKRALILKGSFENLAHKDKSSYLEMIDIFINKDVHRRNHVEFIYAALKNMQEFGVIRDIEVYKKLIDVMPKGKFIPTNMFQVEFQHYPKQQQCMIDLLDQMEDNGKLAFLQLNYFLFMHICIF